VTLFERRNRPAPQVVGPEILEIMNNSPSWLNEACQLPVAFAQVREDALLDMEVVRQLGERVRVLMVASGGCTAAALASLSQTASLHLVDPNPAQLALTRLKVHLLATATPAERLELLGHAPMDPTLRRVRMTGDLEALGLAAHTLGPEELVGRLGPDHAGRYERLFAALQEAMRTVISDLAEVLSLEDPTAQARLVEANTELGGTLDRAFDQVMALPNLVRLFGEGATRNRVEPFARHFARRTRHVLATLPAATNPYLWQMLRGRFPPAVVYPWLAAASPARLPTITWSAVPMANTLAEAHSSFDLVHLSNILDWLPADEARHTLELAGHALRSGGLVLIRQLNSTLDIPALGGLFAWQPLAPALHARDRSFFYRGLYLGRKP
jgi:S-adenosylmethionine-diacylglycerol 3-amino-3-carboxypropyl transferase